MPEAQLDEEQYKEARKQVVKALSLDEDDMPTTEELKKMIAKQIAKYKDHDDEDEEMAESKDDDDEEETSAKSKKQKNAKEDDDNEEDAEDKKEEDDEGMITMEEYKQITNPAKIPKGTKIEGAMKSKKDKKDDKLSTQEQKKQREEHTKLLREQVDNGTFTIEHPAQGSQRRDYTVSIAVPGSLIGEFDHPRLKTFVCGEIARMSAMYRVDEIIIYSEGAKKMDKSKFLANIKPKSVNLVDNVKLDKGVEKQIRQKEDFAKSQKGAPTTATTTATASQKQQEESWVQENEEFQKKLQETKIEKEEDKRKILKVKDENVYLANILYFLETPPYLRTLLFPLTDFLKDINLLYPLSTPHHQTGNDVLRYREGVVTNDRNMVYVGLPKLVAIDEKLEPGTRVTIYIERTFSHYYYGQLVHRTIPKKYDGLYWGYNVRVADSLSSVWLDSPYETGYDVTVLASDRGESTSKPNFALPRFRHMLMVIPGVNGIQNAMEKDTRLKNLKKRQLFEHRVNVAPNRAIRVIRAEEMLFAALGALTKSIDNNIPPQPQNIPKTPRIPWQNVKPLDDEPASEGAPASSSAAE